MTDNQTFHWFPLRIAYSSSRRVMELKGLLDSEPFVKDTFVPMEYRIHNLRYDLVPAINNLIFINTSFYHLKEIKSHKLVYDPLRYVMHTVDRNGDAVREIVTVPERQMTDFIRVVNERNDKVVFLDNLDFACRPGQKVEITDGLFVGVQGVIKRIKGNVCVVVPIEDVAAVAITGVPKCHLRYIES